MNRILAPTFALAASPALAHTGAHLHPHESGGWLSVALTLGLIAISVLLLVQK